MADDGDDPVGRAMMLAGGDRYRDPVRDVVEGDEVNPHYAEVRPTHGPIQSPLGWNEPLANRLPSGTMDVLAGLIGPRAPVRVGSSSSYFGEPPRPPKQNYTNSKVPWVHSGTKIADATLPENVLHAFDPYNVEGRMFSQWPAGKMTGIGEGPRWQAQRDKAIAAGYDPDLVLFRGSHRSDELEKGKGE